MEQLALFALPLLHDHDNEETEVERDRNGKSADLIADHIDVERGEDDDTDSEEDSEEVEAIVRRLVDEPPELDLPTVGRPHSHSSASTAQSKSEPRHTHGAQMEELLGPGELILGEHPGGMTGTQSHANASADTATSPAADETHPYSYLTRDSNFAPKEANCAICGAPPFPECPHEGERLELALSQAMERWAGLNAIREWVLNHARNQIIATFNQLRAMMMETHWNYLESLPYYTLYRRFNGQPPLQPAQTQLIHSQINQANTVLQQGIDQDWRTSCMRYPEVLDYYFNFIGFEFPSERYPRILDPRFGPPVHPEVRRTKERRRIKERRESIRGRTPSPDPMFSNVRRTRQRRRSIGGGTPPPAPMPSNVRRVVEGDHEAKNSMQSAVEGHEVPELGRQTQPENENEASTTSHSWSEGSAIRHLPREIQSIEPTPPLSSVRVAERPSETLEIPEERGSGPETLGDSNTPRAQENVALLLGVAAAYRRARSDAGHPP